jgi:endonuclease/exonuclease/phosphatase family metal-dependent hydrolase
MLGPAHANWVFVRVSGQEINTPVIVGSTHLPVGAASPLAKRQLAVDLGRLTASYPDAPLMLMGDFNLDLNQLQRLTADWPGICQVAKNEGDLPTVRCVDHVCLRSSEALSSALPRSRCSKTGTLATTVQQSMRHQP